MKKDIGPSLVIDLPSVAVVIWLILFHPLQLHVMHLTTHSKANCKLHLFIMVYSLKLKSLKICPAIILTKHKSKSKSKCLLAQQCGTCLTNTHNYNRNTHTKTQKGEKNNCTGNSNIRVIIRWNYSIHEKCILPLALGQLTIVNWIPISVYVYIHINL